ncbi:unnamed protein product [Oppiella nova]|uniref:Endonuclease n=1 Tax=Oppiella nova TaxID=334625 RepID=A0A7R9M3I3_9ACAR|nr:unnamed protein product [Oppiella nova]CAG2170084.1 unnamed protein product [Oppiella nova]
MIRPFIAGLVGVGAGIAVEKYRNLAGITSGRSPAPPTMSTTPYATVFAAKPIDPKSGDNPKTPAIIDTTDNKSSISGATDWPSKSTGTSGGRLDIIARHGFPALDTIRVFDNFILAYDRRHRTAHWVLEHMSREHLDADHPYDRSGIEFFEDHVVHDYWRSTNQDYHRSGYDRGHLAAAGNHRRDRALIAQTFILSNIAPQVGKGFNRDVWNRLEKYVRWRARRSDNLWVCTGPLYLPAREPRDGKLYVKYEVIGRNHVSVPTHFFKVVVWETAGAYDMEAYVLPNQAVDDRTALESFRVPIDTVERAAGLLFFQRIPRHEFRSINGKSV